jgi:aminoglycoside phosphotransferase (APT) family kinase protein
MIHSERLSVVTVAGIVRAQFPDLHPHAVRWLGEGCDSTAFEVNSIWVFRFPKRSDVERQLLLEMRVLPVLARQSPLPVPEFRFEGAPAEGFERRFGGYAKIEGEPAILLEPGAASLDRLAPALGRFLSWLHAFNVDEAARLGVPERQIPTLMLEAREECLADFERLTQVVPDGPLAAWRAYLEAAPRTLVEGSSAPALVHGDFAAEHVLHDPETLTLTGVIDWSELAIGDVSMDLAGLFHWGGRPLVDAVLAHYTRTVDGIALRRARYLAACRGVADVAFGLETGRPEYVSAGLRALTHCMAQGLR